MKHKFTISLLLLFFLVAATHEFYSCKKIDLKREILLITKPADSVTYQGATLKGEIADPGEENSFSEYGFVYSLSGNPATGDEKVIKATSWQAGLYDQEVVGLESNTTYYFRTYALQTGSEPVYGNVLSFKTALDPNVSAPTVGTISVLDITSSSAKIIGMVTSNGGAPVSRRGFTIGTEPMPDIDNNTFSENGAGTGEFQHIFLGLMPETEYFVRAYAQNQVAIAYGNQISFFTEEGGGPVSEWLHYDDGVNFDGIGLLEGGNFDVAIRFTPEQLAPYNGLKITKFKIFIRDNFPVEYYLEIFKGAEPTVEDLIYEQYVESPIANQWNEIDLSEPHFIDASKELYVGYYVTDQPQGSFPAGIDEGPGVAGFGDLIGTGNPLVWQSLSNAGIDANWNIQVFVTNQAGEEVPMTRNAPGRTSRESSGNHAFKTISSQKSSR